MDVAREDAAFLWNCVCARKFRGDWCRADWDVGLELGFATKLLDSDLPKVESVSLKYGKRWVSASNGNFRPSMQTSELAEWAIFRFWEKKKDAPWIFPSSSMTTAKKSRTPIPVFVGSNALKNPAWWSLTSVSNSCPAKIGADCTSSWSLYTKNIAAKEYKKYRDAWQNSTVRLREIQRRKSKDNFPVANMSSDLKERPMVCIWNKPISRAKSTKITGGGAKQQCKRAAWNVLKRRLLGQTRGRAMTTFTDSRAVGTKTPLRGKTWENSLRSTPTSCPDWPT